MQEHAKALRRRHRTIGLVPTMGYLHAGHASLIRRSVKENDETVVSIFVNPAQFGPAENFKKYPRDLRRDTAILEDAGADVLFYPSAAEMYPEGYATQVNVERLSDVLCGASRPGHFRGVATVVAKLFHIVGPDAAYFGRKDAQQELIIKKMAADLNMDVEVKVMPIVRESDGLAMSSRNIYLNADERKDAVVLRQGLVLAKRMVRRGERSGRAIRQAMKRLIRQKRSARIDYVEVVDPESLRPVGTIRGSALITLAVYIGATRLIDNCSIKEG